MPLYKSKGIVLKNSRFDESAKLVTLFTFDYGKIRVIAKGAKRPTSKFGGRLEPFNLIYFTAAKGRSLDILSQCETIERFENIRSNPEQLKMALYFLKIINASTDDGQKNLNLFKLLYLSLKKLNDQEELNIVERYFEVNFLKVEGLYRRDVPADILIGEHLGEDVRKWKI